MARTLHMHARMALVVVPHIALGHAHVCMGAAWAPGLGEPARAPASCACVHPHACLLQAPEPGAAQRVEWCLLACVQATMHRVQGAACVARRGSLPQQHPHQLPPPTTSRLRNPAHTSVFSSSQPMPPAPTHSTLDSAIVRSASGLSSTAGQEGVVAIVASAQFIANGPPPQRLQTVSTLAKALAQPAPA